MHVAGFCRRVRIGRLVAAALLVVSAAAAAHAPATSASGFGGCSNPPSLSSQIPGQAALPLQAQPEMNCFAWQEFIALNWRADPTTCAADPNAGPVTFGDPSSDAPVVWQTYKSPGEVFLSKAQPPSPWCSVDRSRTTDRLTATSELSTATQDALNAIAQGSGPNTFLTAQSGELTLYEERMNHDEFAYVDDNGLYNLQTQQRFVLSPGIDLPDGGPDSTRYGPDGTIELKAAWLELNDPGSWPRYLTMRATVAYPRQTPRTVTVGLVGLHIIRKLPNEQQLVWATFEHDDNAPDRSDPGEMAQPHTYYDPSCAPSTDFYRCRPNDPPDSTRDPLSAPNQVERVYGLTGNAVTGLNADVQQLIAQASPASVFRNYELVNVLWPNASTRVKPGATIPLPANMAPADEAVANSVLETYAQYTTCTDCHVKATIAGSATLASDYSFLLGHARSPSASRSGGLLAAEAAAVTAAALGGVVLVRRRRRGDRHPADDRAGE